MGQSSVHCLTDSLARCIGLPGLSVCHALIAVGLDSCLNRHEPSRCQLYPSTAAPHGHCLLNTKPFKWTIIPADKRNKCQPKMQQVKIYVILPKRHRYGSLTLLVTWPAGLGFTSYREQKSTVLWRPAWRHHHHQMIWSVITSTTQTNEH